MNIALVSVALKSATFSFLNKIKIKAKAKARKNS